MMRRVLIALAILVIVVVIAAIALRLSRRARDARARADGFAAISATIDILRDRAWIERFETERARPLVEHDRRWQRLFGNVLVDPRLGAVGDPEGGWVLDGGDDYAFRLDDVPSGSIELVAHGWWNGDGAIGVQAAVQPAPPHRLYEATLWRQRLEILYFHGPEPDRFEVLAASPHLDIGPGHYLIRLHVEFDAGATLSASLAPLDEPDRPLARITARDDRLGPGGVGIGLLGGGRDSWFGSLGVQPMQHPPRAPSDSVASTP